MTLFGCVLPSSTLSLGADCLSIDKDQSTRVLRCFLSAFDDYTLDRRGDIGAWVREAAMQVSHAEGGVKHAHTHTHTNWHTCRG